jgi:putative transposase
VFFVVCDGLKGLPDAVNAVFPQAIVQACVIHLIRATLRYASKRSTGTRSRAICGRSTPRPPRRPRGHAFEELEEKWGKPTRPSATVAGSVGRVHPFLAYDVEIRRVLFSTNAIVILSQLQGVVDVADGLDRSPIVRAGRAYLQPSSRHGRGRFGVRCSSGGVRLAA